MMNLVIIVQVFPPSTAIGARRFGEISAYLEEFGYKPWIVTTHSPGQYSHRIPNKQVIEIGEYKRGELGEARWAADFPFIRKIENWGYRPIYLDPSLWTWGLKVWRQRHLIQQRVGRIDFILGSFGPPSTLWLAKKFSKEWRVPWIADLRDLGALRKNNRISPIRYIDSFIERHWLDSCSGITTVSPTFAELLRSSYDKRCEVIFNGYDNHLTQISYDLPLHSKIRRPYVHFAGQIYPNQVDSFKLALNAFTQIKNIQLVFRILGPRHIESELIQYTKSLNLQDRVLFLEPVPPSVVSRESAESIANLVVAQMYEPSKGTVPAKVFGLLPLKPPILGIGPDDSDIGNIMRKTKKGSLCRSEREVAEFIQRAIQDPNQFAGKAQGIEEFSRKNQTEKLARFIDTVLGHQSQVRLVG